MCFSVGVIEGGIALFLPLLPFSFQIEVLEHLHFSRSMTTGKKSASNLNKQTDTFTLASRPVFSPLHFISVTDKKIHAVSYGSGWWRPATSSCPPWWTLSGQAKCWISLLSHDKVRVNPANQALEVKLGLHVETHFLRFALCERTFREKKQC